MGKPGTKLYGVFSAQIPDNVGETVVLDGIDDRIKFIRDEHGTDDAFHNIGVVYKTRKIHNIDECEDDKQLRCWHHAQAPFLYGEGELFDGEDHPDAVAVAAAMRFLSANPGVGNAPGFSLDGGIIQRLDSQGNPTEDKERGKILAKTLANTIAWTVKPACGKAIAFLENDLAKSDMTMPMPTMLADRLAKSQATSSVIESLNSTQLQLFLKFEQLKKSLENFKKSITSIKCHQCGTPSRFFKSDTPNRCPECDKPFNMRQIWSAWNK